MKALPPLQQLIKTLVRTEFEQNIHVLRVFEKMLELHNICVSDAPVNFNLTHQFLLGSRPRNTGLLYYFGGLDVLSLLVLE